MTRIGTDLYGFSRELQGLGLGLQKMKRVVGTDTEVFYPL